MKTSILNGTGAKELSNDTRVPTDREVGNLFSRQIGDWGGELSAGRLAEWAIEAEDLSTGNHLLLIGDELFVPFYADEETGVEVVLYSLVDWLLAESPCHGATIADVEQTGVAILS